ncbi:MAG: hypothetical protein ABIQ15_02520 [Nocardioides sp.]
MTSETYLRLLMVGCLSICAASCWHRSRSSAALTRRGRAFVLRNLASIEDRFVPMVEGRFRRAEQASAGLAAVGAVVFLVAPLDWADGQPAVALAMALAGVFGTVLALQAAGEAARELPLAGGAARTARVRAVEVADLVAPWPRRLLALQVVVLVSVLVVLGVALRAGWLQAPTSSVVGLVVAGLANLVAMGTGVYAARRAAALPEVAGDAAQLYWQDALRAESVTQAYTGSTMSAVLLCSAASGLFARPSASAPSWVVEVSVLLISLTGVMLAAYLWTLLVQQGAAPWFRQRLWPTLGAGDVIAPGPMVGP